MTDITTSLIAVVLISASPIGEILIAIPAGVALGLEPALVFVVALIANTIPAAILLPILEQVETKFPRFFNYFANEGGRFRKRLQGRYGSVILLLITPFIGVYAASIGSRFLRFAKWRSFTLQFLSLMVYGGIETFALYFGMQLIPRF